MDLKIWHLVAFATAIIIIVVLFLPNTKEQGVLLARSGKIEQAEKKLQEVIAKNPLDVRTVEELARGYLAANKLDNAISVYEDYLSKGGESEKIKAELARLYISNFEYDDAARLLVLNKDANLDKLIDLSVKTGNLDKAVEYSKDKLALLGSNTSERIRVLKNIEKYEQWQLNVKGIEETKEELAKSENSLEGNVQALRYFVWKNNKEKMRYYARKVAGYKNLNIDDLRLLRTTWIAVKNAPGALKAAKEITQLPEVEFTDYADYMTLLEWTGQKDALRRLVDDLLVKFPDNTDLYWKELAILPNDGRSLERAKIDEKLYSLTGDVDLLRDALLIYKNTDNNSKTVELYKEILNNKEFVKNAAGDIRDELLLAEIYSKFGAKEEAESYFTAVYKRLLSEGADSLDENTFWGAIAYAQNNDKKLETANLYASLYRLTNDVQMLRDARNIYIELKMDNKSLAIDKKLLAVGALNGFDMLQMSNTYRRLGNIEEANRLADSLYKRVLDSKELTQNYDEYWTALDAAEAEGNRLMRAKILQRFYQVSKDPELLREVAAIYRESGMDKDLLALYKKMEKDKALNSFDLGELLAVYTRLGLNNELEDLIKVVYKNAMISKTPDKNRDQFYLLLDLLQKYGLAADRLKLIQKYAAAGDVEARILLAIYYKDSEMLEKARLQLEKIIADKSVAAADRIQAQLQLANIVSTEFYAADTPVMQIKIMSSGEEIVKKAIADLELDKYTLTGQELRDREDTIDGFRILLIRLAFLKEDYIEVDQLLTELYNPDSGVYLDLAVLFYNAGEEDTARRYFKEVDNTHRFTQDQYAQLGYMYLSFKDYDNALLAYMKADSMAKGLDKNIRLGLAAVYGKLGEEKKQYRIVDFYTTFRNASVTDWVTAADARVEHNDLSGEYQILRKAIEKRGESAILIAKMVSRLIGLGKNKEAVVYAKKLEGLKVIKEENDLLTVGYGLLDVGQVREAGRMFAVASNIDGKSKDAKLALARYFVACYQYPEAHRIYKEYLKEHRTEPRVWYEYAVLKNAAGFVGSREAFLTSKQLFQNGKQGAEELSFISSIDFYLNKRDSALKRAKYATMLDPDDDVYALNLAELYNSYNYPEYGKLVAQTVKENDFNSSRRSGLLAEAELMSRRFIEGIDDLKKVLQKRPGDSAAQLAKGYSEVEIGKWIDGAADLAAGEIMKNREEEKRVRRYESRAPGVLDGVVLPELEGQ